MTSYGTVTYTYNGDGHQATKTINGGSVEAFTWGQTTPGTQVSQLLQDGSTYYIYGPDGHPLEQINGTTTLYYLQDQLGSTRVLTSSTGTVTATDTYTGYGAVAGATGTATNPFGYAGEYTDPTTGLQYDQARYYDPTTAQFTTVDPLQAQTQQPYDYTTGDPINLDDPSGLMTRSLLATLTPRGLGGLRRARRGGRPTATRIPNPASVPTATSPPGQSSRR